MMQWLTRSIGFFLNMLVLVFPSLAASWSFHIFCSPFKAKVKSHHKAFLDTAEQGEVMVDGKKVKVYRWGRGAQKILLVHGWRSNAYRWKDLVQALSKDEFSIYAFDAPGHGQSDGWVSNVPLFEASITAVIARYGSMDVLVGHSVGSFSIGYHLYQKPDHEVKKWVSLATPKDALSFVEHYQRLLGISKRLRAVTEGYFEKYAGHKIEYYTMQRFCENIDIPTLIIHDRADPDTPFQTSVMMAETMPNTELVLTEGKGHNLRGQEVLEDVVAFLSV